MRLGQFARKYDIRVQDIISYLEGSEEDIHSNTKLSEEDETDILDFFGIEAQVEVIEEPSTPAIESPKIIEEDKESVIVDEDAWMEEDSPVAEEKIIEKVIAKPAPPIPSTPEEDIALAEGEIGFMPIEGEEVQIQADEAELEEAAKKVVTVTQGEEKKSEPKEDEVIDTERLMALLESEEEVPELDKIKLIKAPKKELSGLKVLGKVDLPEPKRKEVPEKNEEKKSGNSGNKRTAKSSDDDWEQRRLKAKAKRERNEARVARQKKEKEEKERIARNAIHYKKKLEAVQPKKKKAKVKKQVPNPSSTPVLDSNSTPTIQRKVKVKEQPKSVLGKMWKWLTNPD